MCTNSSVFGFSPSFTRTEFYQQVLLWCSPWAQSKKGVFLTPARPLSVALYLLGLTEDSLQRDIGCSVIDSAPYGVSWVHKVAGLESPTGHPTVVAAAKVIAAFSAKTVFGAGDCRNDRSVL